MTKGKTHRGFDLYIGKDYNDKQFSIQKSSIATNNLIWLGIDFAEPKILASKTEKGGTGWVDYLIPEDVSFTTRMHLTRDQVKEILPILKKFVKTGEIK
jgi:hypothetical protein